MMWTFKIADIKIGSYAYKGTAHEGKFKPETAPTVDAVIGNLFPYILL
jgi:hypothetical protein